MSPVTDGGRNPSYSGRFPDETPEMHLVRLAQARRIAALEALLVEWEGGMYDGPDFLRRVRLALLGTGLAVVTPNAPGQRAALGPSAGAQSSTGGNDAKL